MFSQNLINIWSKRQIFRFFILLQLSSMLLLTILNVDMDILYEYLVSGIVDSGIQHFGGEQCYKIIPVHYHLTICAIFGTLSIFWAWRWHGYLTEQKKQIVKMQPNRVQMLIFWIGLISLVFALYYKVKTKRGFFILNPCHITLLILLILLYADNSNLWMRKLCTAWTSWLFGALTALVIPHLEDLDIIQQCLFFTEHLIILPIGPLVLYRRYNQVFPTLKNHLASFSTVLVYQIFILVIISRNFKVNLNFSICSSPSDPFYSFGSHYFTLQVFNLCVMSYFVRLISYLYTEGFFKLGQMVVKSTKNRLNY